jgi:hypothetical protein
MASKRYLFITLALLLSPVVDLVVSEGIACLNAKRPLSTSGDSEGGASPSEKVKGGSAKVVTTRSYASSQAGGG